MHHRRNLNSNLSRRVEIFLLLAGITGTTIAHFDETPAVTYSHDIPPGTSPVKPQVNTILTTKLSDYESSTSLMTLTAGEETNEISSFVHQTKLQREDGLGDDGIFYPSLALNPSVAAEAKLYVQTPFKYLLEEDGVSYPPDIGNITLGEVLLSLEHDLIIQSQNDTHLMSNPDHEDYPSAMRKFNEAVGLITPVEWSYREHLRTKRSLLLGKIKLLKALYCNPLNCCILKVGLKKFFFSWPCCLKLKLVCCACFWG